MASSNLKNILQPILLFAAYKRIGAHDKIHYFDNNVCGFMATDLVQMDCSISLNRNILRFPLPHPFYTAKRVIDFPSLAGM